MAQRVHELKYQIGIMRRTGIPIPDKLRSEYRLACRLYERKRGAVNVLKPVQEVWDLERVVRKIRKNGHQVPKSLRMRLDYLRNQYAKEKGYYDKRRSNETQGSNGHHSSVTTSARAG